MTSNIEPGYLDAPSQDARLSWGARGLLVYLLTHDGEPVDVAALAAQGGAGRDKIQRYLSELTAYQYLYRQRVHSAASGRFQWAYLVNVWGDAQPLTLAAPPPSVSHQRATSIQRRVLMRDAAICQYCGVLAERDYEIDHVIPRSIGGVNRLYNLVVACRRCNKAKKDQIWHPRNLDTITAAQPDYRARVIAEAVGP